MIIADCILLEVPNCITIQHNICIGQKTMFQTNTRWHDYSRRYLAGIRTCISIKSNIGIWHKSVVLRNFHTHEYSRRYFMRNSHPHDYKKWHLYLSQGTNSNKFPQAWLFKHGIWWGIYTCIFIQFDICTWQKTWLLTNSQRHVYLRRYFVEHSHLYNTTHVFGTR